MLEGGGRRRRKTKSAVPARRRRGRAAEHGAARRTVIPEGRAAVPPGCGGGSGRTASLNCTASGRLGTPADSRRPACSRSPGSNILSPRQSMPHRRTPSARLHAGGARACAALDAAWTGPIELAPGPPLDGLFRSAAIAERLNLNHFLDRRRPVSWTPPAGVAGPLRGETVKRTACGRSDDPQPSDARGSAYRRRGKPRRPFCLRNGRPRPIELAAGPPPDGLFLSAAVADQLNLNHFWTGGDLCHGTPPAGAAGRGPLRG